MKAAWKGLGVATIATALVVASAPAQAAQTYTIKGSKILVGAEDGFQPSGCSPAYVTSPLNGLSSVVVDIKSRAGQNVPANWSADRRLAGTIGGSLRAVYLDSNCVIVSSLTAQTGTPGAWTLRVPATAKWLVIESLFSLDVRVNF